MILLDNSNIRVLGPASSLDYFDSQTVALPREVTPLEIWNLTMKDPRPVLRFAFSVRDAISTLFGVKPIRGFSGKTAQSATVGDHLDFFLIEHADDTSLTLTARDRHLDVMTCISTDGPTATVTSSVKVHNCFGHVYMMPVGIAHRWIVRSMFKRLQRRLAA
ncbi:MAG: DUF2867 domain-containing protein [Rhodobacteraceae bacterium]|nr:DUF2867 domain-containing protein [Paracoccaceae bacterium]